MLHKCYLIKLTRKRRSERLRLSNQSYLFPIGAKMRGICHIVSWAIVARWGCARHDGLTQVCIPSTNAILIHRRIFARLTSSAHIAGTITCLPTITIATNPRSSDLNTFQPLGLTTSHTIRGFPIQAAIERSALEIPTEVQIW